MTGEWTARACRVLRSVRKEIPAILGDPDIHDDAEVAAMLRELGMALVEVEQPTQIVAARLLAIAEVYTAENVRVVALPRLLLIQVGTVGYELDTSVAASSRATIPLNAAARIDEIAELADVSRCSNAAVGSPT